MATAVFVPRTALREPEPATAPPPPSWHSFADALMTTNTAESVINLNGWSYEASSTVCEVDADEETESEYEYEYAVVEDEAQIPPQVEAELDEDADNIYDALTCDYDIPLTPGTATPSPCVTPLRTPRESPSPLHAHIASAAITTRLASRVESEATDPSYAFERLRACCISCVLGLQTITNALIGDQTKERNEAWDELVELPIRPGSQVHFLVHRAKVEPESDEDYELGEDDFGLEDE